MKLNLTQRFSFSFIYCNVYTLISAQQWPGDFTCYGIQTNCLPEVLDFTNCLLFILSSYTPLTVLLTFWLYQTLLFQIFLDIYYLNRLLHGISLLVWILTFCILFNLLVGIYIVFCLFFVRVLTCIIGD